VPDERGIEEQRTVESIRLSDAEIRPPSTHDQGWDFEIVSPDGKHTFVEMKIRERDPKGADYQQMFAQLRDYAKSLGGQIEIWNLNVERLTLQILTQNEQGIFVPVDLAPINVWDYGAEGDEPFERSKVLEEVEEWSKSIDSLYADIELWASKLGLGVDRSRSVTMSEELMQNFAVPDRTLPILDVTRDDLPVVSFVPTGLWVLGAHGRIDAVTRQGTRAIINVTQLKNGNEPEWRFIEPKTRKTIRFDEKIFTSLIASP
jgi:hypothetical protein